MGDREVSGSTSLKNVPMGYVGEGRIFSNPRLTFFNVKANLVDWPLW